MPYHRSNKLLTSSAEDVPMSTRPIAEKNFQDTLLDDGCGDQHLPAFAPVAERNADTKTHPSTFLTIKSGEKLLDQWKKCDHVYLVREGLVKLLYTSDNGSEVSLGLRSTGWYAGAASVLLGITNPYSVLAVSDCKVTQIPAEQLFAWTTRNVKKLHQFMKNICLDSILLAKLHTEINSNSPAERLEHLMQERITTDPNWKTVDPLPLLKQRELAQLLSVSPEHLSRLRKQRMHDEYKGVR
jgi:CRP-like cAMP-binding protein